MVTTKLASRQCVACTSKTPPLSPTLVQELLPEVPEWQLAADGKHLSRSWRALNFLTALDFFRRIGEVAEAQDHHPDLHLTNYRDVSVEIATHEVGGLTENDFILAAKIDGLTPPKLKE